MKKLTLSIFFVIICSVAICAISGNGNDKTTVSGLPPAAEIKTSTSAEIYRSPYMEELKSVKKEVKKSIKEQKVNDPDTNLLLLVIIAILIPPLAVALKFGIKLEFWIDLILTLIFYFPGLIYALYLLLTQA